MGPPPWDAGTDVVQASGGIVWRDGPGDSVEVLIVHRPRYDDWSFAKGKAESDEDAETCALREVLEETGYECELGAELASVWYHDNKGRPKVVRYWAMEILGGSFEPNEEVDTVAWVDLDAVDGRLSYDRDRLIATSMRSLLRGR